MTNLFMLILNIKTKGKACESACHHQGSRPEIEIKRLNHVDKRK